MKTDKPVIIIEDPQMMKPEENGIYNNNEFD